MYFRHLSHLFALAKTSALLLTALSSAGQTAPFAYTQPVGPVSSTNVTLNGMVTPNGALAVAWFEWGTGQVLDQVTPAMSVGSGTSVVRVSAFVDGLTSNADYRCRLVASNVNGVAYGPANIFTTGRRVASWAYDSPVFRTGPPPAGLGEVVKIAFGDLHALALKPDGTVSTWGRYHSGFSGLLPPAGLSNVIAIAGGSSHCVAARSDGSVVAWGYGFDGQTNVPVTLTNAVAIESGHSYGLALRRDGTVVAWGTGFAPAPATVPTGLSNVVAIASGDAHCLALRNDGKVITWAFESSFNFPIPTGLSNVIAIAGAYQHSLALKTDGTVVGWGLNDYGQMTPPLGLTNVIAIAAGAYQSLALKGDGSIVAWGQSLLGQTNIPSGLNGAVAIATGDYACLALAPNVPPQAVPLSITGAVNRACITLLKSTDRNGDPVAFRIASLPTRGSLCQFTVNGCGSSITTTETPVTDPLGRVIFVPLADESGFPYTSFTFIANDGELDSALATMTVNVVPSPVIELNITNNMFSLSFVGFPNATYRIWASTNLINWSAIGSASQPSLGNFLYSDVAATNWPWRFYRVTCP